MTNLVIFIKFTKSNTFYYIRKVFDKKTHPKLEWVCLINFKIYQTLISTSTPEGSSSFINASTVLAEAL